MYAQHEFTENRRLSNLHEEISSLQEMKAEPQAKQSVNYSTLTRIYTFLTQLRGMLSEGRSEYELCKAVKIQVQISQHHVHFTRSSKN